jgi:hypothetical protein
MLVISFTKNFCTFGCCTVKKADAGSKKSASATMQNMTSVFFKKFKNENCLTGQSYYFCSGIAARNAGEIFNLYEYE